MTLLRLFLVFARIGLFTFGGGYAMIPLIQQAAEANGWLDAETLYGYIGVCESTPGPIAVNMATFIGADQAGLAGSICATFGVVLPSFVVILLIAAVMKGFRENRYVRAAMTGIRPVVAGMILGTGLFAALKCLLPGVVGAGGALSDPRQWIILAALAGFSLLRKAMKKPFSPILLILLSAGCGAALYAV